MGFAGCGRIFFLQIFCGRADAENPAKIPQKIPQKIRPAPKFCGTPRGIAGFLKFFLQLI
jgi:hypothetical protein